MRLTLFAPLVAALAACATADGKTTGKGSDRDSGPVIVELFTSQGCSSCPPADQYLSTLAEVPKVGARAVTALSFHVDYWNELGWVDPYSQPAWTERQKMYVHAFRQDRIYTPQIVVGGAKGMVGSQKEKVAAAIAAARRPARLSASASWAKDHVEVAATAPADADVYVAVWEDAATIEIEHGENAGTTLTNRHVVRRLERVAAAGTMGRIRVPTDPAWRGRGAVAFAQRADRRIVASAELP